MAISRVDFWSFIIEEVTRKSTMGLPALEDGLFANLLIFYYLYVFRYFCKGKGREKEREKGREKGRGKGRERKKGREGKVERTGHPHIEFP